MGKTQTVKVELVKWNGSLSKVGVDIFVMVV